MKIYGIDFTSAPTRQKPIVVACCKFDTSLDLTEFYHLYSLSEFSTFLETEGPWVGGFDFPFSQPRKLIENIGFPTSWEAMMQEFSKLSKSEFAALTTDYCASREPGDKHHRRHTDVVSNSISPMMLYGVPVAKMFHAGAVALWQAPVSIIPMRPVENAPIALEIYPALVARAIVGRASYKNDTVSKNTTDRKLNREQIVTGLSIPSPNTFDLEVNFSESLKTTMIDDFRGDCINAMSAALLAAWGWSKRDENFGIPAEVDPLEGWIINPFIDG